jgi:hypothetical protein
LFFACIIPGALLALLAHTHQEIGMLAITVALTVAALSRPS